MLGVPIDMLGIGGPGCLGIPLRPLGKPSDVPEALDDVHPANATFPESAPPVGVIMGSRNDAETLRGGFECLDRLGIAFEAFVVSAHRTPGRMSEYARTARRRGVRVIIAAAGGAAHLPGMVAGETSLPVIGVPVRSRALSGMDSLLSIVQMPRGVPVATMAIGEAGGHNAALFAARILGLSNPTIAERIESLQREMADDVRRTSDLSDLIADWRRGCESP